MDTKTALLDTAETLARTRGFEAFSFADLSAAVGIRKASIHHHFPTKAHLARDLITRYTARIGQDLAALSHAQTGAGRLRGFLYLYREALDGGRQICLCVAFGASRESFDPDVIAGLAAFHSECRMWLETAFGLGQSDGSIAHVADPRVEAAAALALVEGAQLLARAEESPQLYTDATAALAARLT